MKTLNLRDANQQFSKLVREIKTTNEPMLVLRNNKPMIKLMPAKERTFPRKLTSEQEATMTRFFDPKNRFKSNNADWKISRDALHDEIESRHAVVRARDAWLRKNRS